MVSLLCIVPKVHLKAFFFVAEISCKAASFQPMISCPPELLAQGKGLLPPPAVWRDLSLRGLCPEPGSSLSSARTHFCPQGLPAQGSLPSHHSHGRCKVWLPLSLFPVCQSFFITPSSCTTQCFSLPCPGCRFLSFS